VARGPHGQTVKTTSVVQIAYLTALVEAHRARRAGLEDDNELQILKAPAHQRLPVPSHADLIWTDAAPKLPPLSSAWNRANGRDPSPRRNGTAPD
jgi:hypothetical protein